MVGRTKKAKKFVVPLAHREGEKVEGVQIKEEPRDIKEEQVEVPFTQDNPLGNPSPSPPKDLAVQDMQSDATPEAAIESSVPACVEGPATEVVTGAESAPPTEAGLSTIDAQDLGLLWAVPEPPTVKPKKRGRKPKVKNVEAKGDGLVPSNAESELVNPPGPTSDMRFPQSMVNGVLSIDMSGICLKTEQISLAVENTTVGMEAVSEAAGASGTEKKAKKPRKKAESGPKSKRGRPKRPKQEESSSAPSSPVKKPVKRGRKMKDAPQTPQEPGVWSTKKIMEYQPEDYRKLRQAEVLNPDDLVGFEDVEVFHFDSSEFAHENGLRHDGFSDWWFKEGAKIKKNFGRG